MEIKEAVDKIVKEEINSKKKILIPLIKKNVNAYLNEKGFRKELKRSIREYMDNFVFGEGPMEFLTDKEQEALIRKAIKAILK